MGRVTARRMVVRIDTATGDVVRRPDTIAAEEPLEIRIGETALTVTMRTPGDDLDLALGFLLTEGIITGSADVRTAQLCAGTDQPNTYNVVRVELSPGVRPPADTRAFPTTSACGVCGKASIDAVRVMSRHPVADDPIRVTSVILAALPDRLRQAQQTFTATGGLHAAGLFTPDGNLIISREDIGRHNAVDKVIGAALRAGSLPLGGHVLVVSGRASFELAQKAWLAGIPILAAVSAPSTLAVELADQAGVTLAGFVRGNTMNIYTHPERISATASGDSPSTTA